MKSSPDTLSIRKLPAALTTPPRRPREMAAQEIVIWSPRRALAALFYPHDTMATLSNPERT